MTVIDTVTADTVEAGDVIEYVTRKGNTRTLYVTDTEDTGGNIVVTGNPDDLPGGERVTVKFQPDDYVDIIGS